MASSVAGLVSRPSLVEWRNLRFLIMDAPKESNLHLYLKECKKYNVTHIVRISEPSYSKDEVEKAGITLHVRTSPMKTTSYLIIPCAILAWVVDRDFGSE